MPAIILLLLTYGQLQALQHPAVIPLPQSVTWTAEQFPLSRCREIVASEDSLVMQARTLAGILATYGVKAPIKSAATGDYTIQLQLNPVPADYLQEEAYHLLVTEKRVVVSANTAHGIFNGLQTLYQLITARHTLQGCNITDYPAYRWRGYMVDVGRNFQSVTQLKQQIDIMARYKINIFHFHLTEDVAWRLQVAGHPELTSPESMTRNKGQFYSIAAVKELIQYCKDRFITLVPEIDIPGHSTAFRKATGEDMQSEKGSRIIAEVIDEVAGTYNIPFIHIGADEVGISNKDLLPHIAEIIHRHGKEVITWAPGGDPGSTIRQMWRDEKIGNPAIRYIDSRSLYLSDLDPLNSVVTIFNRQIGERTRGDESMLGAEICLWSDRRAARETDLLSMTPVYPSMLAFAERSWRGGGYPGVMFYIGEDSSQRAKDFAAFEARLLLHKQQYFSQLPFPYVKQTGIHWKLFGPFENKGELTTTFWPEGKQVSLADSTAALRVTGGTIWLWHTHSFMGTTGWLPAPKENTTWYAFTRFWSNSDTTLTLFTELKDLSRSGADATPPAGEWDYMKSRIWLNNALIPPPVWAVPGREAGRLEDPLVNEGFSYRPPTTVKVKKGWNSLLVKLPLSSFDPMKDWQQPPKLMYTVIPVHREKGINWYENNTRFHPGK